MQLKRATLQRYVLLFLKVWTDVACSPEVKNLKKLSFRMEQKSQENSLICKFYKNCSLNIFLILAI